MVFCLSEVWYFKGPNPIFSVGQQAIATLEGTSGRHLSPISSIKQSQLESWLLKAPRGLQAP